MKQIITIFLISISFYLSAQNTKQTNFFSTPEPAETEFTKITFKNPVAKYNYCKIGLQIENLSNSFLLFKKNENQFVFDFGNVSPQKKNISIAPNSKKTPTLKVEGSNNFIVEHFDLEINGLYQIPINGEPTKVEDFDIPASKSKIKANQLEIKLLKLKKKTQESSMIFEISYYGNKVIVVDESNLVVQIESGDEFINENTKSKIKVLEKGKTTKIKAVFHIPAKTADMQFEKMKIVWKDTFVESNIIPLPSIKTHFTLDKALTKEKN